MSTETLRRNQLICEQFQTLRTVLESATKAIEVLAIVYESTFITIEQIIYRRIATAREEVLSVIPVDGDSQVKPPDM